MRIPSFIRRKKCSVKTCMSAHCKPPYMVMGYAMAAVGLVLYAWTAVCREALVVKVVACSVGDSGGEGDGGAPGGEGDAGQVPGPQLEP